MPVLFRPTLLLRSLSHRRLRSTMTTQPRILSSFQDLTGYLREENIEDVYLFIGNGARLQYKELSKVCESLYPIVKTFKKPWLAAFGGDRWGHLRNIFVIYLKCIPVANILASGG